MTRPPKPPGTHYETPKRPGWRVPDETWLLLQNAAKREGKTLVGWALPILVRAAKRVMSHNSIEK